MLNSETLDLRVNLKRLTLPLEQRIRRWAQQKNGANHMLLRQMICPRFSIYNNKKSDISQFVVKKILPSAGQPIGLSTLI